MAGWLYHAVFALGGRFRAPVCWVAGRPLPLPSRFGWSGVGLHGLFFPIQWSFLAGWLGGLEEGRRPLLTRPLQLCSLCRRLQHSSAAGFLATGHVPLTPQSGDVTAIHHGYAAACAPRATVHRAHRKWTTPLNLFRKRQTVLDRVTVLVVPRPGTVKQWPFLRRRASVTVPVERNRVFDLSSSSSLTGMEFLHAPINFALATSRLACVPDYVVNP